MIVKGAFEKAKNYIDSHTVETKVKNIKSVSGPCITISRESGAGAEKVSEFITEIFAEFDSNSAHPWTVFDQNLIEKVLQDHNLPYRLSEIMEERKYSAVSSILNELIGGQPGTWTLFHKTTETILQLAHMGYSIVVERGGNIVTAKMDNCLHVRLVGTKEDKIKHVQNLFNYDRKQAIEYMKKEDDNRKEYISAYFHKNIEDPLLYHLVINTSEMSYRDAAELICSTAMKRNPEYFRPELPGKFN